ncbi:MAG TPA: hypothetical protein VFU21_08645 [Kofleriaceae bacterium]|nr:hypothetical protein [Kofleriaceae bacterium]
MPRVPGSPSSEADSPAEVVEYADQAVQYVRRAVGLTLEYDSETLPVLDHYLRSVPGENAAAAHLVAATAGAYFGEVVRRRFGGEWDLPSGDPGSWRVVLPTGLWFSPAAMALAVIVGSDEDGAQSDEATDPEADAVTGSDWDASLNAPGPLRPLVAQVLDNMADVSHAEYYSLCGRLDTIEHVQSVLAGVAQARRGTTDGD